MPGGSSAAVTLDVQYLDGKRSRLTTLFRYFTLLPHAFVLAIWGYAVYFVTFLQWFVAVFAGRRSRGLWDFQRDWLAYASRVESYAYLVHDKWPAFGAQWGDEPVAFQHQYVERANRLTSLFRAIVVIPFAIVAWVLGLGAAVVLVISWFAIVFTGKQPRGMFDFLVRVLRYAFNLNAFALLMTDAYPRYDSSTPVGVLTPGDGRWGAGALGFAAPPPPPSAQPLQAPPPPPTGAGPWPPPGS